MTEALPKIWNTTFTDHTINVRNINYHIRDNTIQRRIEGSNGFLYPDGKPLPADLVPEYIFFDLRDIKEDYKTKTPDLVMITNGLLVISEKFRDLLADFDMGNSLIHEVPLYEYDQTTRRPGRWFILHITANKKTVIPEKSENVEETFAGSGRWKAARENDVLAVRADAAPGADLWIDANFRGRIFLSDRLRSALKPAGIRVRQMPMRPCIVIA
ncbi:imm11 family protein [Tabrizicola sp.]|uniref:imm11 family protein n=1 Tax=Tabrizicola sp. TaxID=2005166 RepID=UPI003F4111CA